jgi:uncharacterized membrane protein
MMALFINFLALFLLMLVTGACWGPWFAVTRSLSVLSAGEFIKITRILSANLGPAMRFLLPGCILIMGLAVWLFPHQAGASIYLGITSVALIIVSLVVTVAIEVPIVKEVEQWTAATVPSNWTVKRDRWLKFHIVRVLVSLAAFACFSAAMLLK